MSENGTTKRAGLWESIVLLVIGIVLFGAAISVFSTSTWMPLLLGVAGLALLGMVFGRSWADDVKTHWFNFFLCTVFLSALLLSIMGGAALAVRAVIAANDLTTLKTLRTELKDREVLRGNAYGSGVYTVQVVDAFNRKRSKEFRIDKKTYDLLKNARLHRTLEEVLGSGPELPGKD